jgi:hypothetical protein
MGFMARIVEPGGPERALFRVRRPPSIASPAQAYHRPPPVCQSGPPPLTFSRARALLGAVRSRCRPDPLRRRLLLMPPGEHSGAVDGMLLGCGAAATEERMYEDAGSALRRGHTRARTGGLKEGAAAAVGTAH